MIEMSSAHESVAPQTIVTSVAYPALMIDPDLQELFASHLRMHGSFGRHDKVCSLQRSSWPQSNMQTVPGAAKDGHEHAPPLQDTNWAVIE